MWSTMETGIDHDIDHLDENGKNTHKSEKRRMTM
jgi:hypothetical protein